ncbi:ATP-binding cassette sub-family B member 8, mitochondrial [Varanus komodoensis]|nr:ATP-binding cassette sub-family B member 8, mitochondrial [Varanus komodoensis]
MTSEHAYIPRPAQDVLPPQLSSTGDFLHADMVTTGWLSPTSEQEQLLQREHPRAISKVLPVWEEMLENDSIMIVSGIQSLQNNISLALACEQAQAITQNVVMGIIREAKAGKIPMEVTNLIRPELTKGEIALEAWWRLLNASYDSTQNILRLFLITVEATQIIPIYPVVPLGFQLDKDLVMYSRDLNRWAHMKDGNLRMIGVAVQQGCCNVLINCEPLSPSLNVSEVQGAVSSSLEGTA